VNVLVPPLLSLTDVEQEINEIINSVINPIIGFPEYILSSPEAVTVRKINSLVPPVFGAILSRFL
jgi:hypothetical protein